MSKRITTEEFIEKVKSKNQHDLDLTKFVYINNKTKGVVKCNVCKHEWETVPSVLLTNHGCPRCAIKLKADKLSKSKDVLIEEFKKIHGDKYDYSKVIYKNDRTEIEITCQTHGEFYQKPNLHLRGHGCPKCANSGINLTKTEFINKLSKFDGKIDFSEFDYKNCNTKGKCKCLTCGHEWYSNYKALRLSLLGCPECALKSRTKKRTSTIAEFIERLKNRYPNITYDFSNSTYKNALTKMEVICKNHGVFKITPNDLMSGVGCPICNDSRLEKKIYDALVENNIEFIPNKSHSFLLNEDTNHCLTLDFYLPKYNIAIECQGEQHFIPIEHFGGNDKLEHTISYDRKKKNLCELNGVKLIYFLDNKFNKYMNGSDIHFNNVIDLIRYIKGD